jgi:hypothetical protein
MFAFLKEDAMFELVELVRTTAFFRRTGAATRDPFGDGWWLQSYNTRAAPAPAPRAATALPSLRRLVPGPIKKLLRSFRRA